VPDFLSEARAIEAEITQLRHELHEHPELGLNLPWTQGRVLEALAGLPLEITLGTRSTSITAVLRGGAAPADIAERPVVLLRGDMDGLPIPEATGMPFSSKIEGLMHGCGHDIHTATLTGAAKILSAHAAELPGDVVFMFQTAEEIFQGARAQIADGVLDAAGKRVDRAFGMHVMSSTIEHGMYVSRHGTCMAAADILKVDIIGKGGHGAAPHSAIDPVPVMAEVILALQTMVARKFFVFDPVVVTVGVANAGGAANVIPEQCHIECSIRTFSVANRAKMEAMAQEVIAGVCAAHGCRAEMDWIPGVPPTVNTPEVVDFAAQQIEAVLGEGRYRPMTEPYVGSEDFSEVLLEVPGCFIFYSGLPADRDLATATFNHSATAWFDDCVIGEAMAVYCQLAWASLFELAE